MQRPYYNHSRQFFPNSSERLNLIGEKEILKKNCNKCDTANRVSGWRALPHHAQAVFGDFNMFFILTSSVFLLIPTVTTKNDKAPNNECDT